MQKITTTWKALPPQDNGLGNQRQYDHVTCLWRHRPPDDVTNTFGTLYTHVVRLLIVICHSTHHNSHILVMWNGAAVILHRAKNYYLRGLKNFSDHLGGHSYVANMQNKIWPISLKFSRLPKIWLPRQLCYLSELPKMNMWLFQLECLKVMWVIQVWQLLTPGDRL